MKGTGPWKWIKLGCLAVGIGVVLLVGCTGALFGTAYLRGQREDVTEKELSRELPSAEVVTAGRVVLDLAVGEFRIRAGRPGEPLRVEAKYDAKSYRLTEDWEGDEHTPWTYRLTFEETSWFKDGGLRALLGGSFPEIEITLPPDVPLALEGRFAKGGTSLDLGGLSLTEVIVNAEKGGFDLVFDEPLATPLERLVVHAKQGGTSLRGLGNASPRRVEIDHRMGGLSVDLKGEWVGDSDVNIVSSMGGADVLLPRDVVIEGLEDRLVRPPPNEKDARLPRLRVSISESFGKVAVIEPR